jgi:trimethylamine-N-oxide reductase (cytochrome c)
MAKEGVMSGRFPELMKAEGLSIPKVEERPLMHSPDISRCFAWREGDPKVTWYGGGTRGNRTRQFQQFEYPWQDKSPVRFMWWEGASNTESTDDGNNRFRAHQEDILECVVTQHQWWQDTCFYSDIVLPVNTKLEEYDMNTSSEDYGVWCLEKPAIKSIGESMSDYEIVGELAKKLDFYDKWTGGKTIDEWVKEAYDTSGMTDVVTWEELNERGYYIIGLHPDAAKRTPASQKFYDDPVKNPLATPTGLLEFWSTGLAENFPDDKDRPPLAHWIPGGEGYFYDEYRTGKKAQTYPLQMISNTPKWRYHSQHDDIPWLRELSKIEGWDGYWYEPVQMNPADAEARGIKDGDKIGRASCRERV